jgi:glycerophosphoryl diester phosphodiesterase
LVEQPFAAIRAAQPAIPTLAEALEACAGMLVNVEVKCLPWEADADPDHTVVRAAVDLIRERDAHVVISSFDLGTIDAVRSCAPELRTGFLVHRLDLPVAAALAREHGHAWLHPDVTATLADLDSVVLAHELGLQVDVWTVDDPAQIRTLATAGVDAIITNAPDVALAALG